MYRAIVAALALGLMSATPVAAATYSYSVTTDGGPTWNRPFDTTGLSMIGNDTPYHVESLQVSAAGSCEFLSEQDDWDGFLFLYESSFDPDDQLTNLLALNDDFGSTRRSGFDDIPLNTGVTYFLVTTGFANASFGAFTNSVTGDGVVTFGSSATVIPVPAALPMLLTALAGFGLLARRRCAV